MGVVTCIAMGVVTGAVVVTCVALGVVMTVVFGVVTCVVMGVVRFPRLFLSLL